MEVPMSPINLLAYSVLRAIYIIAGCIFGLIAVAIVGNITNSNIISAIVFFAVFILVGGRRIEKE